MSNVQQTSLLAYSDLTSELAPRQKAVADCVMAFGPMNNKQIANRLHWPINSVTGRVLELRNRGVLELERTDVDQTGRKQMFWKVAA
jgi:predicted ArsR family transcriptional regulator